MEWVTQFRFGGGAGEIDFGLASKDTDTRDPNALDVIVGPGQSQAQVLHALVRSVDVGEAVRRAHQSSSASGALRQRLTIGIEPPLPGEQDLRAPGCRPTSARAAS